MAGRKCRDNQDLNEQDGSVDAYKPREAWSPDMSPSNKRMGNDGYETLDRAGDGWDKKHRRGLSRSRDGFDY